MRLLQRFQLHTDELVGHLIGLPVFRTHFSVKLKRPIAIPEET
jgi:hypothetical protein